MTWKPIERQSLRKAVGNEPRVLLSTFSYGCRGSDARHWRAMISFRAPPAWLSAKGAVEVCQGSGEHAGMLRLRPTKAPKGFSFMLAGGKSGPVTCQIRLPTWIPSMEAKRKPEECLCTFSDLEAVITLPVWAVQPAGTPMAEVPVAPPSPPFLAPSGHPSPAGEPDPSEVQRRPPPEAKPAPPHEEPVPATLLAEFWANPQRRSILRQSFPRGDTMALIMKEMDSVKGTPLPSEDAVASYAEHALNLKRPPSKPRALTSREQRVATAGGANKKQETAAILIDFENVVNWGAARGITVHTRDDVPLVNAKRSQLGLRPFSISP